MKKFSISLLLGALSTVASLNAANYYCDTCGQYDGGGYYQQQNYGYYPSRDSDGYYSQNQYQNQYQNQNRNWGSNDSRQQRNQWGSDDRQWGNEDRRSRLSNAPWAQGQGQGQGIAAIRDSFDSQEDRQILQRIRERLSQRREGNPNRIGILVLDKEVILVGRVNDKDENSAIEDLVNKVEGVKSVNNKLKYPGKNAGWFGSNTDEDEDNQNPQKSSSWFGSSSDDDQRAQDQRNINQQGGPQPIQFRGQRDAAHQQDHQLLSRIRNALERDGNSNAFRQVEIRVTDGRVLLTGGIPTNRDRQTLKNKINRIDGIEFIDDRLDITGDELSDAATSTSPNTTTRDDDQIKKDISYELKGGIFSSGYDDVRADVSSGRVTLRGSVPTDSDLRTVLDRIQKIRGVRSVDNQLTVRNIQK